MNKSCIHHMIRPEWGIARLPANSDWGKKIMNMSYVHDMKIIKHMCS